MQLKQSNIVLEKSQDCQVQQFGIGDEAFLIELARSKLYKNPLRVFPQEYLANARDAHVDAGKEGIPVDITMPTILDPELKVRDYGLGMSPETISSVFTQYGVSTKRTSDKLTGGFGIGSKSAWSYTDSFSITTIYDHIKYSYQAYLDESKKGALVLLDQEYTNEPSGTEIGVLVALGDIGRIHQYIFDITFHWRLRPNITNIDKIAGCYEGIDGKKLEKDYDFITAMAGSGCCVLIDEIPYTVDYPLLQEGMTYFDDGDEAKINLTNYEVQILEKYLIKFSNKELKAAPNRGEIDHQTVSTYETLKAKAKEIKENQINELNKELAGLSFLNKVRYLRKHSKYALFYSDLDNGLFQAYQNIKDVCFNVYQDDWDKISHFIYTREQSNCPQTVDSYCIAVSPGYDQDLKKTRQSLIKVFPKIKKFSAATNKSNYIKYHAKIRWSQFEPGEKKIKRVHPPEDIYDTYYLTLSDKLVDIGGRLQSPSEAKKLLRNKFEFNKLHFVNKKDIENLPQDYLDNNRYDRVLQNKLFDILPKGSKVFSSSKEHDRYQQSYIKVGKLTANEQLKLLINKHIKLKTDDGPFLGNSKYSEFIIDIGKTKTFFEIVERDIYEKEIDELIKEHYPMFRLRYYSTLTVEEIEYIKSMDELNTLRKINENRTLHRHSHPQSLRFYRKGPGRRKISL